MAMASALIMMASTLIEMASTRIAMASTLVNSHGLQPKSDGLQPRSEKNKKESRFRPHFTNIQSVLFSAVCATEWARFCMIASADFTQLLYRAVLGEATTSHSIRRSGHKEKTQGTT